MDFLRIPGITSILVSVACTLSAADVREIVRSAIDGREVAMGEGPHTLGVEAIRAEPRTSRCHAGLDAIVLEPVK